MTKYIIGFIVGISLTGSLFQFNIGLPSYESKALRQLQQKLRKAKQKIRSAKDVVKKKKAKLAAKSGTKTLRRSAAAAIPVLGTVMIAALSINEYCADVEENIKLSNILNDTTDPNNPECIKEAKKDAKGYLEILTGWIADWKMQFESPSSENDSPS